MTDKIKQKVKQKTNIKININLSEKKKKRKQRKKRTMKSGTNQALQRAQQILFSQATNVPRTVEQQNSGMIMDNFRNQQQQLNKHSSLINTGISQLNFIRDQIKNYQPVQQNTTTPPAEFKFEIPPTPNKPEKPEEPSSPKINYGRIAKMAGWNQKQKTLARVKEIYDNYFKDLTDEEIEDEYATEFKDRKFHGNTRTREGKIGKLIEARFSNVTTERGGGASPLFQPEEEQTGLFDDDDEQTGLLNR